MSKAKIFFWLGIIFLGAMVTMVQFWPEKVSWDFSKIEIDSLVSLRNIFEQGISQILAEPESSFLAGLLVGSNNLPWEVKENFKQAGVTHIIALSGYNVTIIVSAVFNLLLGRIARYWAFVVSTFLILIFTVMTGASPSLLRGAIMGILVILASNVGRLYYVKNALVFTAAVMVLLNPMALLDIGFQLSFAATLGLVYLQPLLEEKLSFFPETLNSTLAAQVTTLPIIWFYFGRISWVAPMANLLILPLIPATMFLGFMAGMVNLISPWLGQITAWPVWALLHLELWIIQELAKL